MAFSSLHRPHPLMFLPLHPLFLSALPLASWVNLARFSTSRNPYLTSPWFLTSYPPSSRLSIPASNSQGPCHSGLLFHLPHEPGKSVRAETGYHCFWSLTDYHSCSIHTYLMNRMLFRGFKSTLPLGYISYVCCFRLTSSPWVTYPWTCSSI